jgi:nucleoid-associated protein
MATLKKFIVHQFTRDVGRHASLVPRPTENDLDDLTDEVMTTLLTLFNKTGLKTGSFDQDGGKPKFEQTLLKEFNGNGKFDQFRNMTIEMSYLLLDELNQGAGKAAKPGYIVFFYYESNGGNYLSVVTLQETTGMILENLSFKHIERLDLDKLHLGARIKIDSWQEGIVERYISFRVGRNTEMRDYFSRFIGCKEFTAAKVETSALVKAIKQCCEETYPDQVDLINEKLADASRYCRDNVNDEGKIDIEILGRYVFPEKEGYLLQVVQNDPYNLGGLVSIDKGELKALVRYRGKTPKMSISFDADLLDSKIFYSEQGLVFTEIPRELKAELDARLKKTEK